MIGKGGYKKKLHLRVALVKVTSLNFLPISYLEVTVKTYTAYVWYVSISNIVLCSSCSNNQLFQNLHML